MNYNKKTVQDIDVAGKKVLLRCDFNVPMAKDGSGVITDDKRIRAALPTIQYLLDHNAAVIACSHMGKPNPTFETYVKKQTEKGERSDGEVPAQAAAPTEEQKPAAKPKRKPARAKAPKAEQPVAEATATQEEPVGEAPKREPEAPAKRAPKRPAKATAKAVAEGAAAPSDPEAFIRQTVAAAEPEGIALSVLGKRVRGKFRTFKLRDLGYAQFRPYLGDLDGIKVEQRDGQSYARLDR